MSTPFSHFFTKINQISPLEHEFTEVLEAIALTPKTLYFRGKLPENVSKTPKTKKPSGKGGHHLRVFRPSNASQLYRVNPGSATHLTQY